MKKAADLIKIMIDNMIQDESQREAVSLFSSWSEIAGIDEGAHSKIEEIENGIVYVEVDHPGWLQKLEFKKRTILKKLQKSYPELKLKDVRIRL